MPAVGSGCGAAVLPRPAVRAGRRIGRQPRGPDGRGRATAPPAGSERRCVDGRRSRRDGRCCRRGRIGDGGGPDAARWAGRGRPHRLPGRATEPDPAPAARLRPAPGRPARPGLGAAAPPGGVPGDQGSRRHAAGAADRAHGRPHRPARGRPLLPARDPEHRRERRRTGRQRVTVGRGAGVDRPDRAAGPDTAGLHDQEGRHAPEGGPGARAHAGGAARLPTRRSRTRTRSSEGQQIVIPVPSASDDTGAGGASAAPSKKP